MSKSKGETWHLSFVAEGEGPPIVHRVRSLLKTALRAYGLRCVRHVSTEEGEPIVLAAEKPETERKQSCPSS